MNGSREERKFILALAILVVLAAILCSQSRQESQVEVKTDESVEKLESVTIKRTEGLLASAKTTGDIVRRNTRILQQKSEKRAMMKIARLVISSFLVTALALLRRLLRYFNVYRGKHTQQNLIIIEYISRSDGMK